MADRREFPIGALLTATTGKMLCGGGFGVFHEFAEFMAGGPVWTHELVALCPILKREVSRQHPDLPLDANVEGATFPAWMDDAKARYGETRWCEPIPDYGRTADPLTTAQEMFAKAQP